MVLVIIPVCSMFTYAETMEADQRTHGESKLNITHGTWSRN
jgi:hypothetical protein